MAKLWWWQTEISLLISHLWPRPTLIFVFYFNFYFCYTSRELPCESTKDFPTRRVTNVTVNLWDPRTSNGSKSLHNQLKRKRVSHAWQSLKLLKNQKFLPSFSSVVLLSSFINNSLRYSLSFYKLNKWQFRKISKCPGYLVIFLIFYFYLRINAIASKTNWSLLREK